MVRDIKEEKYGWFEGRADSLKWGENILLMADTKEQLFYAEKCLKYLDCMPSEVENRLIKYLIRYFNENKQYLDEEELEGLGEINEENILKHIQITVVIVNSDCRDDRIEFHIEGNCEWEPEHGLEITISDDKILYVGPYADYAPNSSGLKYALENYGYYDSEEDSNMNYVDEE